MKNKNKQIFVNIFIIPLMALVAPFLVFIIEIYLPYPYLIEEIIKFTLIFLINKEKISFSKKIILSLAIGFLFSISENFFYFTNFFYLNSPYPLIKRFLFTSILHFLTSLIMMLFFIKKKGFFILGLILAILIHYLYNLLVI